MLLEGEELGSDWVFLDSLLTSLLFFLKVMYLAARFDVHTALDHLLKLLPKAGNMILVARKVVLITRKH